MKPNLKLNSHSVFRLHLFLTYNFSRNRKKALIFSLFLFTFFLKHQFWKSKKIPIVDVPNNLFNFPGPLKEVNYNPISHYSQILFLEFGGLRKTVPDIILMSASDNDFEWKLNYLNDSLNFIAERFKYLTKTNENFGPIGKELNQVVSKIGILKKRNSEEQNQNMEFFLESLGVWYQKMKNFYNLEREFATQECSKRMRDLENQIARRIYQIQQGELCEQSSGLLHLR